MADHSDRVIAIAAPTGGVGNAVFKLFLEKTKCRLSLGVRNVRKLDPMLTEDSRVQIVPYDAKDLSSAENWVKMVCDHFGTVTDLIDCTGCTSPVNAMDPKTTTQEKAEMMHNDYQVNAIAPYFLAETFMKYLEKASTSTGKVPSNIIWCTGTFRSTGVPSRTSSISYPASKSAHDSLFRVLEQYCYKQNNNVRATMLRLGRVNTGMVRKDVVPNEDLISPEQVAEDVYYIINSLHNRCFGILPIRDKSEFRPSY